MYKISLVITVKNYDEIILKNLKSLTKQYIGFENLEIILIGDKNIKWEPLDAYSKKYPHNIFTYKLESYEQNNYKNIGIKYSTSEYIMFLDTNEFLFPDACETLYGIIKKNSCDIAFGNFIYKQHNQFKTNSWKNIPFKNGFYEIKNISENLNVLDFQPLLGTKIFNRNFLIKNNIKFNNNSIENLIFMTESLKKANKIIIFNKPLLKLLPNKLYSNEDYNRKLIIKAIDDLDVFYTYLKKKSEYTKFIFKYVEEIFSYILSKKLPEKDLLTIFIKINNLIKDYEPEDSLPNQLKTLLELIANEKFDYALKVTKLLNEKRTFNTSNFQSKDIIMLFYGFDHDIGGLAKAVFNRASLLSQKGHKITLINTDPYTENFIGVNYNNYGHIENKFRELGYIHPKVKFYNIIEYFKEKNTIENGNILEPKINLKKNIQIYEEYLIQKIKDEHDIKVFNYHILNDFNDDELNIINNLFEEPLPPNIDNAHINKLLNKTIIKTEYYVDNILFIESINGKNNQTKLENIYTKNGFKYLQIEKNEKNEMKYTLRSSRLLSEIIFNKYKEFCDYFVKEICLNCDEKPFLINDCSGPIPSFNNVPHEMAYKIANIHSNPFLEPTYNYGCPRREMSALKCVTELDALVALTETEKNDFIKEFEIENLFAIPNLINFEDIHELNKKRFEVDENKISIFARISPEKNLEDLIKAFKIVTDKHPQATLSIYGRAFTVGEKIALNNVNEIIDQLNMKNNVIFEGHVDDSYTEMRKSLATILVSHIEGLPMVIIESMANKTPVICYDINYGPKDVITNGEDGFIVEKYNIEELSEKINYIIENPEIAIKMGEKAQENIFHDFDLDRIYEKWVNVFKESYFNSIFREIINSYLSSTYIKETDKFEKIIEDKNNALNNTLKEIQNKDTEINNKKQAIEEQKKIIEKQENEIKKQENEIKKQEQILEKQRKILEKQEMIIKKIDEIKTIENKKRTNDALITNLKTTNEYYKLKNNPKKRLTLILPYLYIILKHKNIIENIKFYRKITKNNFLDIGYYLNSNPRLKRNKWCKILTPETHYTCHGFDEKRLPHPNYKNNLTKKEIIKVRDNNV